MPAHLASPALVPAHLASPALVPAHLASSALVPAHLASPALVPAHLASSALVPAHLAFRLWCRLIWRLRLWCRLTWRLRLWCRLTWHLRLWCRLTWPSRLIWHLLAPCQHHHQGRQHRKQTNDTYSANHGHIIPPDGRHGPRRADGPLQGQFPWRSGRQGAGWAPRPCLPTISGVRRRSVRVGGWNCWKSPTHARGLQRGTKVGQ